MSSKILLQIEYYGTSFAGWQRQKSVPTVQGELEKALSTLFSSPITLYGASRTDSGTHALVQAAHFTPPFTRSPQTILSALNSLTPSAISISNIFTVSEAFHARHSALEKEYIYALWNDKISNPLLCHTTYHVAHQLDIESMKRAIKCIVGTHDFSAFRNSSCSAKTTTRTLTHATISQMGSLVCIRIRGNGFLHHMVRILCGTLIQIGLRRFDSHKLEELLSTGDRSQAGNTLPAHGLFLSSIRYPPPIGLLKPRFTWFSQSNSEGV